MFIFTGLRSFCLKSGMTADAGSYCLLGDMDIDTFIHAFIILGGHKDVQKQAAFVYQ